MVTSETMDSTDGTDRPLCVERQLGTPVQRGASSCCPPLAAWYSKASPTQTRREPLHCVTVRFQSEEQSQRACANRATPTPRHLTSENAST